MIKVSVIIPCFNSEKTIKNTLDSLSNQIYKNFEVVIINDGSKDRTSVIIDKYRLQSKMKIVLMEQKNQGVSVARNVGMNAAVGEYIAFLDADDEYHPLFLWILTRAIKKYNTDIAMCKYQMQIMNMESKDLRTKSRIKILEKQQLLDMYFHKRVNKLSFGCALYKSEIIKSLNIQFAKGIKYGEDNEFFGRYLYHCNKKAVFIDRNLYRYVQRDDSATHTIDYRYIDNIKMFQRVIDYWGCGIQGERNYIVYRAIWSAAKNFAMFDKILFKKFQEEYDVRQAMRYLSASNDELSVVISSILYIISPRLFSGGLALLGKSKKRLVNIKRKIV